MSSEMNFLPKENQTPKLSVIGKVLIVIAVNLAVNSKRGMISICLRSMNKLYAAFVD